MAKHTVKQGECISSIANKYGFFWETLWNLSENTELKQKRKEPNILHPGDEVFIPEKEAKTESCATEQQHRFRKKGLPAKLRIRILHNNEPVGEAEYALAVEGKHYEGQTDADGWIEQPIPPDAREGTLLLRDKAYEFDLLLGNLDPLDEVSGIQGRLKNLGFDPGPVDGKMGPRTNGALREFQEMYGLEITGQSDDPTKEKLKETHGS
ncbi:peptidoglycan-binding protein [bacterium]|nr:peptidoglycan-binding protein [bacterium]